MIQLYGCFVSYVFNDIGTCCKRDNYNNYVLLIILYKVIYICNITAEDDGYLMGYLHDYNRSKSVFTVFNARTMNKEPIFTIDMP